MRRVSRLKLVKTRRKPKSHGTKLDFSERCDQCDCDLAVCRTRDMDSFALAVRHSGLVMLDDEGVPRYFCSDGCLHEYKGSTT